MYPTHVFHTHHPSQNIEMFLKQGILVIEGKLSTSGNLTIYGRSFCHALPTFTSTKFFYPLPEYQIQYQHSRE